jgi:16S rRNA A1518/A1519 N6-dimethyltransferase RsmA/KsgA/DIM1 with predicted DNA glycosylase/AP lyase activity
MSVESHFHNLRYLHINSRRLEHLATLMLPIDTKSVLEVGAGVGDLTSFFLDRGCSVTSIEPRPENIEYFRARYKNDSGHTNVCELCKAMFTVLPNSRLVHIKSCFAMD